MEFFKKILGTSTRYDSTAPSQSTVAAVEPIEEMEQTSPDGAGETVVAKELFPFAVGAISDRGTHRAQNEDALFYLQAVLESETEISPFGIFIVADGLGGHADGQVASDLAVRAVASHILRAIYIPAIIGRGQNSDNAPLNESFLKAIETASRSVREGTHGGGSTLTSLVLVDRTAYIAHVGDSRAYLISDASVDQLTRDHSLGGRLMEIQGLTEEEASRLPERHTLYKALGQPAPPEPDVYYHSIPTGSHLMLCSDGLWGSVSHQNILDAFRETKDPYRICSRLVNLALAQGSEDNVSLIVLFSKDC
jgi:serine/threonine protein phosphatase PrpC